MGTNTQSEETNAFTVNSPREGGVSIIIMSKSSFKGSSAPFNLVSLLKRLLALPQHLLDPGLLEASRGFFEPS